MKILVIGQGGREHAIAWKLAQSEITTHIFVAPGNAGTYREPKVENLAINPLDFEALANFVKTNNISFTVVGPEAPLVAGIVDYFQALNLKIFGPNQFAAQLEGSKIYAKQFMQEYNIPTAKAAYFSDNQVAQQFLKTCQFPVVIKADGLAEGKGVVICQDISLAQTTIDDFLSQKRFGKASESIVIEEFLTGTEVSFIVLSDGKQYIPLATSQDHKARDNGDLGPNTGGMGAYSPAPMIDNALYETILATIVEPTLKAMQTKNNPFVGFLYCGLMITPNNEPKVLEYNCRLGDPETQPILMRLQSDLAELFQHAIEGTLNAVTVHFDKRIALGVVLVADGYPGHYDKGSIIPAIKEIQANTDHKLFHAGTLLDQGNIVTNGGRVLCATALGDSYQEAQKAAYVLAHRAAWDGAYYRTDIGYKALAFDVLPRS